MLAAFEPCQKLPLSTQNITQTQNTLHYKPYVGHRQRLVIYLLAAIKDNIKVQRSRPPALACSQVAPRRFLNLYV